MELSGQSQRWQGQRSAFAGEQQLSRLGHKVQAAALIGLTSERESRALAEAALRALAAAAVLPRPPGVGR